MRASRLELSSGGESGVCVAGQRSARAQGHRKSGRSRGRRRRCRVQQKPPQAECRGCREWKGTSVEVSSPPDAATATRLPGTLTPAPRIMPALTSQIWILSSKQSPRRPAPCPPPAISPRRLVTVCLDAAFEVLLVATAQADPRRHAATARRCSTAAARSTQQRLSACAFEPLSCMSWLDPVCELGSSVTWPRRLPAAVVHSWCVLSPHFGV
jgi:hypothetical protein